MEAGLCSPRQHLQPEVKAILKKVLISSQKQQGLKTKTQRPLQRHTIHNHQ